MTQGEVIVAVVKLQRSAKAKATAHGCYSLLKVVCNKCCDARSTAACGDLEQAEAMIKEIQNFLNDWRAIAAAVARNGNIDTAYTAASKETLIDYLGQAGFGFHLGRRGQKGLIIFS